MSKQGKGLEAVQEFVDDQNNAHAARQWASVLMAGALKEQMGRAGIMTATKVSEVAGLSRTTLSALNFGPKTTVATLIKLAGALGCDPGDFLARLANGPRVGGKTRPGCRRSPTGQNRVSH